MNEIVYIEMIDDQHWTGFPVDNPRSKAEIKKDSLEFVPLFPNVTNFGIAIDKATGSVTAGAPTGGATIHNFILVAKAKLLDGTPISTAVRVHIYDRVRRCWLTPSPLSIYRDSARQRFTLLAEFEIDGEPEPPLIGDLSWAHGVTWSATPATGIEFKPGSDFKTTATTPLGTVKVTATLPAHLGGKTSEPGQAEVVLGFDEQPLRNYQAKLRSGPGSERLMDVPNILFLSEGFQADQEPDWETLIGTLVDDLALMPALRPFDLFISRGSVNIWSLFLPSRDRGSSVLHSLRMMPNQTTWPQSSEGMPLTRYNPNALDVGSMLHQLGLPVRSNRQPADADEHTLKAAAAAKFKEWDLLTGWTPPLDPNDEFRFATWKSWTEWSTRTLADERDTLLGLAFGVRPTAMNPAVNRLAVYHPLRVRREELDKLLVKITDSDDGPLIGQVWGPNGKDRSLVVALMGGARRGGTESSENVTSVSINPDSTVRLNHVDDPAKSLRVSVVPYEIPRSILWGHPRIGTAERGTIVHELGHAFGLSDEYVENGFFGKAAGGKANLTPESELVGSGSVVGDKLVGNNLRWKWPRIRKAALLSDAPWLSGTSASTGIVLPLRRGAKFMFKNDDVVYLRRRPLRGTFDKKLVLAEPSVPLVVTSDNQVGDQIVVRTQDGSNLKVADFPSAPGSEPMVFFAVPPPAYAAAQHETFAALAPLVVRDHITKTGLPLNRTTTGTCEQLNSAQRAALANVPDNVNPFWLRTWVGAFDGGSLHPCGIFHPSPSCIMNSANATTLFCPVCRYILVDAVDPALHAEIDKEYALGYVEPDD